MQFRRDGGKQVLIFVDLSKFSVVGKEFSGGRVGVSVSDGSGFEWEMFSVGAVLSGSRCGSVRRILNGCFRLGCFMFLSV